MPDLPGYQSTAQVLPGPLVDSSPIFDGYQRLTNQIEENTRPAAINFQEQQQAKAGTIAGQKPGFHTISSIGASSKAYNKAGLIAQKQMDTANVLQKLNEFHGESVENLDDKGVPQGITQDSVNGYNEKVEAYANQLMSQTAPENRLYIKNIIATTATGYHSKLISSLNKKQMDQASVQFVDSHSVLTANMQKANREGNFDLGNKLYAQSKIQISDGVDHMGITTKAAQHFNIQDRQSHMLSMAQGVVANRLNAPLTPLSSEVSLQVKQQNVKDYIKSMRTNTDFLSAFNTPFEQERAVSVLKNQANQYFQKDKVSKQALGEDLKASISQAVFTGISHSKTSLAVLDKLPPAMQSIHQAKLNMAAYLGQQIKLAQNIPVDQLGHLHKRYEEHKATLDFKNNPIEANAQNEVLNTYDKQLTQTISDRINDPIKALNKNESYLKDKAAIINNPGQHPNPSNDISNLKLQYLKAQHYSQGSNQLADKDTRADWIRGIKGKSAQDQISFMKSEIIPYVGSNPEHIEMAITNMQKQDHSFDQNPYILMKASLNPESSQHLTMMGNAFNQSIAESLKNQSRDVPYTPNDIKQKIATEASPYMNALIDQGISRTYLSKYYKSMGQIAAYGVSQSLDIDDATKTAVSIVIGKNVSNMESLNGASFIVPKYEANGNKINSSEMRSKITYAFYKNLNNSIKVPEDFDPGVSGKTRKMSYASQTTNTGQVINVAGGYKFRDGTNKGNILVNDKTNKPIYISNKELLDPTSKFNLDYASNH